MNATDQCDMFSSMLQTLRDAGGKIDRVRLEHLGQKYGTSILADAMIKEGDEILAIPLSTCITVEMARSELKSIVTEHDWLQDDAAIDEMLALYLMNKRLNDQESHKRDNMMMLPNEFNTPIFWAESERKALTGTMCFTLTNIMLQQLESDWIRLINPIVQSSSNHLKNAKYSDYIWALSCIWSRAINFTPQNSDQEQHCLVPILSAANHHSSAAAQLCDIIHFNESTQCFHVKVGKNYNSNDQIYILYGQYTNAKLLYTYGFIEDHNPYMGIDFWVDVPKRDSNYSKKSEILQENKLTSTRKYNFEGTIRKIRGEKVYFTASLLSTVRVIQLSEEELENPDSVTRAMSGQIVTVRNERAVYNGLITILRYKLSSLVKIDADASYRIEMAAAVVDDEIELMSEAVCLLNEEIQNLAEKEEKFIPMDHFSRSIEFT